MPWQSRTRKRRGKGGRLQRGKKRETSRRSETVSQENLKIAEDYLRAMQNHDLRAVGKNLDPNVHFKAPLSETHDREAFLGTTRKLFTLMRGADLKARFESKNQALLVYDMVFDPPIGKARAFNLMTFEGDKVKDIEVLYDPRPFEKAMAGRPS